MTRILECTRRKLLSVPGDFIKLNPCISSSSLSSPLELQLASLAFLLIITQTGTRPFRVSMPYWKLTAHVTSSGEKVQRLNSKFPPTHPTPALTDRVLEWSDFRLHSTLSS